MVAWARGGRHDRADVVHALLERGLRRRAVRQPGVALVEQDQAAEAGEAAEEVGGLRVLPQKVQMAHRARHEHDVCSTRIVRTSR
jgi:hypothetical protein